MTSHELARLLLSLPDIQAVQAKEDNLGATIYVPITGAEQEVCNVTTQHLSAPHRAVVLKTED
jgi:hypothetical protein